MSLKSNFVGCLGFVFLSSELRYPLVGSRNSNGLQERQFPLFEFSRWSVQYH